MANHTRITLSLVDIVIFGSDYQVKQVIHVTL